MDEALRLTTSEQVFNFVQERYGSLFRLENIRFSRPTKKQVALGYSGLIVRPEFNIMMESTEIRVKGSGKKIISDNRKARHEYSIRDDYRQIMVLQGTEVKALRNGQVNLSDSYAKIVRGEVFFVLSDAYKPLQVCIL